MVPALAEAEAEADEAEAEPEPDAEAEDEPLAEAEPEAEAEAEPEACAAASRTELTQYFWLAESIEHTAPLRGWIMYKRSYSSRTWALGDEPVSSTPHADETREIHWRTDASEQPAPDLQMDARDQSMSDEASDTVERGEKDAVASKRGWMHSEMDESVLKAVRADEQSEEMPVGMSDT